MLLFKMSLHLRNLFIPSVCMLMGVLYGCNDSGNNGVTDSLPPATQDTVVHPQNSTPAVIDSISNKSVSDTGDKTGQMPPPPASD